MHVLVVTQYFWPETFAISGVVESLASRGVKVTVLTGKPNYPEGRIFSGYRAWDISRESVGEAAVLRIPLIPRGMRSAYQLVANYLSFILSGLFLGPYLLRRQRFDAIFVYAPSPILQAIPGVLMARFHRVPILLWVQDLWPESLSATGYLKNRLALSSLRWVVRMIYRASNRILVQSRAFTSPVAELSNQPDKIHYLPNPVLGMGAGNPSARALKLTEKLKQSFSVVFAGNLGAAQGLDTIIKAAKILVPHSHIQIVLVGNGSEEQWGRQECEKLCLQNLVFAGRFESSDMPSILESASALLVTLRPDPIFKLTIPSKVQSYLASGRPIIAALDGEGALVIEKARAGFCSAAGDAEGLAESILRLNGLTSEERQIIGANGRRYFEQHFSLESLTSELMEHFRQEVAGV
jgi:glycosyltransferase involved in cell wall biosynthesis